MPNSPAPTQILVNYHSEFAPHKMLLNALEWSPTPDVNGAGSLATWDAATVDTDDAVSGLVTLMLPFFGTSVSFDNYVVFTYPTPEADPEPMAGGTLALDGTGATPSWYKAVQKTLTFRTNLFGLARLVFLDVLSGNDFNRNTVVTPASPLEALVNAFTSDTAPWSGRDNGRPNTYLGVSQTLNEKLRRAYRMT